MSSSTGHWASIYITQYQLRMSKQAKRATYLHAELPLRAVTGERVFRHGAELRVLSREPLVLLAPAHVLPRLLLHALRDLMHVPHGRVAPREELQAHEAHAVDVRAVRNAWRVRARGLGGHVPWRPAGAAAPGGEVRSRQVGGELREAEVAEEDAAGTRDEEVLRLDVAVDDLLAL